MKHGNIAAEEMGVKWLTLVAAIERLMVCNKRAWKHFERFYPWNRIMQISDQSSRFIIYVYSRHPLASQAIGNILRSAGIAHTPLKFIPKIGEQVACKFLILDSCSVTDWPDTLGKWHAQKGRVLLRVPEHGIDHKAQNRALSVGVCGIVPVSSSLHQELPQALGSVLNGRLWINRETLEEYVQRANKGHHQSANVLTRFTVREEQIFYLLLKGFSNRKIAAILAISERTVKYHVSNILQKLQVNNRRQLLVNQLNFRSSEANVAELGHSPEAAQGPLDLAYDPPRAS